MKKIIVPIFLLFLWIFMSKIHILDKTLLPSPIDIFNNIINMTLLKDLENDIINTCLRLFFGFSFGSVIGIFVGIAMGRSKKIYESLEFIVDFFRSIPVAALFPLFLVLFGIGDASKIITTAWSTSLIVLINTMYGIRSCSIIRQNFAKTLKANKWQQLITIIVPEALPSIFAGLRLGLSIALIVVILTEMFLGTSSGLGYRIFNASLLYKTDDLYFTIILTGFLGYALNQSFIYLEKLLFKWKS